MERGLLLLVATLMVFGAREVEGTFHLSFSNMTVNISRDGCGESKLCVAEPEDCDPDENNMCFLATFDTESRPPNGTALVTELSGYSMDFVALGLTPDNSQNTTAFFFCYMRDGMLRFRTMERNSSGVLTAVERLVSAIRGNITGRRVQCEFDILPFDISTNYSIIIANGTFSNGTPTFDSERLNVGPLNITNATSNAVNASLHVTTLLVLLSIASSFLSALLTA
ncbi:putative ferric-chelate reductase 1 [Nelusetta ayraudi]|uniref:putative ferric-chelate reductase 1 n=1 Tax=Nelusetta ayraudi TaxID=303726 RepID=UPI003F70AA14